MRVIRPLDQGQSAEGIRSIVCATNFTAAADRALAAAVYLAQQAQARLVVLHVVRRQDQVPVAREQLDLYLRQQAPGFPLVPRVESGEVAPVVAGTARRERADLLFIGRHHAGQPLVPLDLEDAIEDLAPCALVEVGPDEDAEADARALLAASQVRAQSADPTGQTRCTVCGRPAGATICPSCRIRIASEAFGRKQQQERTEGRGMHLEDRRPGWFQPPRRP